MRTTWDFYSTERIVFGNGAIQQLGEILQRLGAKNVLLISDPGIKQAGIVDKVLALLEQANYHAVVYDQVIPEPPIDSALECYEFAKSQNTDAVIGLGGGSSIDMAKIVALLVAHGGHPLDYYGGENQVPGPIAPLVAIPTTAGTGSEVTSVSVLTDVKNNLKVGISDNYLRPTVALLDPELTIGLPSYVTACSGIDALSHAIEAYTANHFHLSKQKAVFCFKVQFPLVMLLLTGQLN
ncbi:iron-containing alcohol dehydrogenase [Fictibacillus sp. WQ 8-8]|uniref:iron-containing alcohol dehydrogenase n=1 Tax=Fictibacillus sp. WQ 8-8 TaxID=2938788 RepID=UPI002108DB11|nr:iron-containing alcohol dehydrogenase [Fictibacillus sp. WQ 8-8]MCQ6264640.1 iron-containing alcohol dehydrogenase [Fictibacillus sp. WQ 8-8]